MVERLKPRKLQAGFTLVELLIVIIVIAILAAISIVAYNGIQNRARTSAVHADLTDTRKRIMMFNVDNGHYPSSASELTSVGLGIGGVSNYDLRPSYSNFYYCYDDGDNEFAVGIRAADGAGSSYYVSSSEGITPRAGLINLNITCNTIGVAGSSAAGYSSSGITATGSLSSWLQSRN